MECQTTFNEGVYKCVNCGFTLSQPFKRNCPKYTPIVAQPMVDELVQQALDYEARRDDGCNCGSSS